jgi:hypothetical protein
VALDRKTITSALPLSFEAMTDTPALPPLMATCLALLTLCYSGQAALFPRDTPTPLTVDAWCDPGGWGEIASGGYEGDYKDIAPVAEGPQERTADEVLPGGTFYHSSGYGGGGGGAGGGGGGGGSGSNDRDSRKKVGKAGGKLGSTSSNQNPPVPDGLPAPAPIVTPVPEPTTALFGAALVGVCALARRRPRNTPSDSPPAAQ